MKSFWAAVHCSTGAVMRVATCTWPIKPPSPPFLAVAMRSPMMVSKHCGGEQSRLDLPLKTHGGHSRPVEVIQGHRWLCCYDILKIIFYHCPSNRLLMPVPVFQRFEGSNNTDTFYFLMNSKVLPEWNFSSQHTKHLLEQILPWIGLCYTCICCFLPSFVFQNKSPSQFSQLMDACKMSNLPRLSHFNRINQRGFVKSVFYRSWIPK